jgi:tetratricopeptide (TPR) repeat protein
MTNESDSSKKSSAQEPESGDENITGDTFNLPGDYRGASIYIKSTIYGGTGNNVRLQNLRDFTVQIRAADSEAIVGTGMIVSPDGKVVTCAHVVKSAGVEPRALNGKELGVYFPQVFGGEKKDHRAKVVAFFPDFDDDVVLLQLTEGSVPLGPERMPVLGTAEKSQGNGFRSYGYRRLEDYIAGWAHGTIQGHVEAPPKRKLQGEPVQLESDQINQGMSGSAVLDMGRNLVVGIISETWFPDRSGKDSDTAWAVDSHVLSLAPLGLPVQDAPLPLKAAPEPKTDEQTKQQVVQVAQTTVEQRTVEEKYSWNNAPAVLKEWTGRDHLLMRLTEDWNDPKKRVTGLIGFGGEGKSSLARKWVETLNLQPEDAPTGIFWWGFYENRSVDEFLEAALNYMSGGRIDPRAVPSSNLRAQLIGSMLGTGRYLFVLDGLEVMQHQDGDQYGLLQSSDLRDLLTFFARPDNQSFCLITSRAPLLDLMEYTTYTHRDVERLSEDDGRALLRVLGVKGSDAALNKVVSDWGGHALTLSILAAYLVDQYDGDIKHFADISIPTADEELALSVAEGRYERVHRLLRRYDEHLTNEEREFLMLFSVFRLPVQESAFEKVFVPLLDVRATQQGKSVSVLSKLFKRKETTDSISGSSLQGIVKRLVTYRIIRHDEHEKVYTTHPLIRNHYFALFTKSDSKQGKGAHEQIKEYYLSIAGDTTEYPTLDDLKPLIEVVHHACEAGAYDEAEDIRWERIWQRDRRILIHQLGAYETALTLFFEFFPSGDTEQEPQVTKLSDKAYIFNAIGFCLMALGRLREALPFYERQNKISFEMSDWRNLSIGYRNLADLRAQLGALVASAEAAREAVMFAQRAAAKWEECKYLAVQANIGYLQGDLEMAGTAFKQAEELIKAIKPQHKYLYSDIGIFQADHLRRIGDMDYSRRVTDANLQICERNHWANTISQCHRALGDLDSDIGDHISAREHYESALRIARGISVRHMLIEALLARGRFLAKHIKDSNTALSDLDEALGYCVESGYRIYEADVRFALAWAYLANNENEKAKQSAERALQMSNEMGYYWGKVDAKEVLERIENGE